MKTINAFKREFPDLPEHKLRVAYQYLEIVAPEGAGDPAFRQIAANSIDERGNLLKLTYTIDKPLT